MASPNPAIVEQDVVEENLENFGNSLLSMENMDRSSPEMWPEKVPGVTDFISSYNNTKVPPKAPYSKELTEEDRKYVQELATFNAHAIIAKVRELQDIAYKLGVEESQEVTRGKYLNIFKRIEAENSSSNDKEA